MVVAIIGGALAQENAPRIVRVAAFNYYPGIFQASDGTIKGFYVDMLAEIAAREHWTIRYHYGTWAEGLERIKRNEVDVLTSVAYTPERGEYMDFTREPLLTVWGQVYVHESSEVDGILSMQGKHVAVMKDDFNGQAFRDLVKAFNLNCRFTEVEDFTEVLKAVESRRVDAGVVNSTYGASRHTNFKVKETDIVFNPFNIYFTVAKGRNQEVLDTLNSYLAKWRANPSSPYHSARKTWIRGTTNTVAIVPRWLTYTLYGLAGVLIISATFVVLLRQQVHRATRELHRREARLRAIFEASRGVGFVITERAEQAPQIIEFSPGAEKIFGYTRKEILGRSCQTLFAATNQPTAEKPCLASTDFSGEVALVRSDGRTFAAHLTTNVIGQEVNGKATALHVIFDLSERKNLEQQLVQAQKMESIGRLAGGVAHDFNNMLQGIQLYTELALAQLRPEDPLHGDLSEIANATQRSADLTRQLLAFARKQTVTPRPVKLNELITQLRKMLQRLIGEDIELRWQPDEQLWLVNIDPSQIDQLLVNLLVNARDAIASTGIITIRTENVVADAAYCASRPELAPGEYVMLTVTDTGHGMDQDTLARIFEPFFTTKELGKGTGMGLATVYGIVKQNNGAIHVSSKVGSGSTFNVYLPRHSITTPNDSQTPAAGQPLRGNETILVIEDDERLLRLTKKILGQHGYRVLVAHTPAESLQIAANEPTLRLLITDIVMPAMNGKELRDRLTAIRPGLRCLFMSGYPADVIARRGILDHEVQFIAKPFSSQALLQKIREVLAPSAKPVLDVK